MKNCYENQACLLVVVFGINSCEVSIILFPRFNKYRLDRYAGGVVTVMGFILFAGGLGVRQASYPVFLFQNAVIIGELDLPALLTILNDNL